MRKCDLKVKRKKKTCVTLSKKFDKCPFVPRKNEPIEELFIWAVLDDDDGVIAALKSLASLIWSSKFLTKNKKFRGYHFKCLVKLNQISFREIKDEFNKMQNKVDLARSERFSKYFLKIKFHSK